MNESIQIVRNIMPGERIPAFSTFDLLIGRAYMDPVVPKPVEQKSTRSEANRRQSLFYAERRAELAILIRKMLAQEKNVPEIAREVGKSVNLVKKIILQHADLERLYKNLPKPVNGMTKKREERLKPHRENIRQWLSEGRSYPYMATKIGVHRGVIRHYVLDHPELRA